METLAPHLPPVLLVRPDSGVLDGAFRSEEVAIHHLRADLIYLEALLSAVPTVPAGLQVEVVWLLCPRSRCLQPSDALLDASDSLNSLSCLLGQERL